MTNVTERTMNLKFEEYSSNESLHTVYGTLLSQDHLVHITTAIRLFLDRLFPEVTVRLFSFSGGNSKYWICLSFFRRHWNFVNIGCEGVRDNSVFANGFREFLKTKPMRAMMKRDDFWVYTDETTGEEAHTIFRNSGLFTKHYCPFYLLKDRGGRKEEKVLDGYSVDFVREDDLDLVVKTWPFSTESEKEYMRLRIARLPSVCIRDKTGAPVAWVVTDHPGQIRHTYVMPEHRKKGLQALVHDRIMNLNKLRFGGTFGTVLKTNTSCFRCMDKDNLVLKADGTPDFILAICMTPNVVAKL